MKNILVLFVFVFSFNGFSAENPYSYLFPKKSLTLAEGRAMVEQVKRIMSDLRPDLRSKIEEGVARKSVITSEAKVKKDACNKNVNCLSGVHEQLKSDLKKVHDELGKLSHELNSERENSTVHLAQVLNQTVLAVVAGEFDREGKKYSEINGITMETDLIPEFIVGHDEVAKYVKENKTWEGGINPAINGAFVLNYFYRDQRSETASSIIVVSFQAVLRDRKWVLSTPSEQYDRAVALLTNSNYQNSTGLNGFENSGKLLFDTGTSDNAEFQLRWQNQIGAVKYKHDRVDF